MQVAVLTSAAGVADDAIHLVAEAVGGKAVRLSEHAAEVPFETGDVPELPGIDVNVVPMEGREKQLFLADMDSTMIPVECIDELADFVGKKTEVAAITERAMQGELDFEAALDARVAMLEGVTADQIAACLSERVAPNPGAEVLVKTMAARGAMTALVSGGFTVFTGPVSQQIGFAMHRSNVLNLNGNRLDGTVQRPIVSSATKLATLKDLASERGLALSQSMAVGDGANDGEMVKAAGIGAAYKAKPALRAVADVVLDHSDLTALLSIQGIPDAEFARV